MSVLPGVYSVTVSLGNAAAATDLEVRGDPRNPQDISDLIAKREALIMMAELVQDVDSNRETLEQFITGVEMVLGTLRENEHALREEGEGLLDSLQALNERLFIGPKCQGSCRGNVIANAVNQPIGRIVAEDGAPSENTRHMMDQAAEAAEVIRTDIRAISTGEVATYRAALLAAGYTPFGSGL